MPDTTHHIALTGHRPPALDGYRLTTPFYDRLRQRLESVIDSALTDHDVVTLHSGLALGADTVWSQVILEKRSQNPGRILFMAEVPCPGQASKWVSQTDRAFWELQQSTANKVNVYSDHYSRTCMQDRNIGMVNAADLLVAVYDGSGSGGTANAVRYAHSAGIEVLTISPESLRTTTQENP